MQVNKYFKKHIFFLFNFLKNIFILQIEVGHFAKNGKNRFFLNIQFLMEI